MAALVAGNCTTTAPVGAIPGGGGATPIPIELPAYSNPTSLSVSLGNVTGSFNLATPLAKVIPGGTFGTVAAQSVYQTEEDNQQIDAILEVLLPVIFEVDAESTSQSGVTAAGSPWTADFSAFDFPEFTGQVIDSVDCSLPCSGNAGTTPVCAVVRINELRVWLVKFLEVPTELVSLNENKGRGCFYSFSTVTDLDAIPGLGTSAGEQALLSGEESYIIAGVWDQADPANRKVEYYSATTVANGDGITDIRFHSFLEEKLGDEITIAARVCGDLSDNGVPTHVEGVMDFNSVINDVILQVGGTAQSGCFEHTGTGLPDAACATAGLDAASLGGPVVCAGPPPLSDEEFPPSSAASGDIDTSFADDGLFILDVAGQGDPTDGMALQDDGRIVVAGSVQDGGAFDVMILRLLADGTLDPTFGVGGTVGINILLVDFVRDVAIDSEGRIVVTGATQDIGVSDAFFVRLLPDGTRDPDFGNLSDGISRIDLSGGGTSNESRAVALDANDKIFFTGEVNVVGMVIGTLTDAGELDGSLFSIAKIGSEMAGTDIAIAPSDGSIVAIGMDDSDVIVLAQTSSSLVADADCDGDGVDVMPLQPGVVTTSVAGTVGHEALQLVIDDAGKNVVAGSSDFVTNIEATIWRFNSSDCTLDTTFDSDGVFATTINDNSAGATAINIDAAGRIVVAGPSSPTPTELDLFVLRLLNDGSLDTSFATNGQLTADIDTAVVTNRLLFDALGRIMLSGLVGSSGSLDTFDMLVMRIWP